MKSMDSDYTGQERRKHTRFKAKDLILVRLGPQIKKEFGQLLDISQGGLSLCYYLNPEKSNNYSELEIFTCDNDSTVEAISMCIVIDKALDNGSLHRLKMLRRQGLRFGDLTREQKSKLDYILKNYTLGNA